MQENLGNANSKLDEKDKALQVVSKVEMGDLFLELEGAMLCVVFTG